MVNKELVAPCGLYCGVCGVYVASSQGDDKLKEKMGRAYGVTADKVECNGCMSGNLFGYCQACGIRSCAGDKGYEGCHQCGDFPCGVIESFPVPEGKKVILEQVPRWREMGTEAWVADQEQKHQCGSCGSAHIRGARRCRSCGEMLI